MTHHCRQLSRGPFWKSFWVFASSQNPFHKRLWWAWVVLGPIGVVKDPWLHCPTCMATVWQTFKWKVNQSQFKTVFLHAIRSNCVIQSKVEPRNRIPRSSWSSKNICLSIFPHQRIAVEQLEFLRQTNYFQVFKICSYWSIEWMHKYLVKTQLRKANKSPVENAFSWLKLRKIFSFYSNEKVAIYEISDVLRERILRPYFYDFRWPQIKTTYLKHKVIRW